MPTCVAAMQAGHTHYTPSGGIPELKKAICAAYKRDYNLTYSPDRVLVSNGAKHSLHNSFTVLCDPGDEVLIPHPSYPLFEHLTRLDAITSVPYDLEYHGTWTINVPMLARQVTPRTRAVLVVSPNNPTGSYLKQQEMDALEALCAPLGIALIVDEVFADYPLSPGRPVDVGHPVACRETLAFSLGGLSKSVGLPQAKLGWIALGGPPARVADAMTRLEFICDTYLSVSTAVQLAAATLLARGADLRAAIHRRVVSNFRRLHTLSREVPFCTVLDVEGGWYAVLQVPTLSSEEDLVVELLTTHGVVVHPGYFFDFARESFLVVSLLTPPVVFEAGVTAILRHFNCRVGAHGGRDGS